MRRLAGVVLAAVAAVVLGACQVTTSVGVDAHADGSGRVRAVVTLDKEAADQVPDLASSLRVGDLRAAGWVVDGPLPTKDGGVEVRASRPFATQAEAARAMAELSGPTGPFQGFTVRHRRSFLKTRVTFRGDVDLSKGLAAFSDDELRKRVGGSDLGFDPAELERRIGRSLDRIFRFQVSARLPGTVRSNAPVKAGNGAQWAPRLGERVTLQASSEAWNTGNVAAGAVSLAAALALVAVLAARALRRSP